MNANELNKVLMGVLGALVFVMGLSVLSDLIFTEEAPEQLGYAVDLPDEEAAPVEETAEDEPSFNVLLASADPAAGERGSRVCSACHSFDAGGGNGIGPALHGVVGRQIAAVDGFGYSNVLSGMEGAWDYDALNGFLENPQGWAPGTTMGYAGIKDAQDRAHVIAYLRSVSPDAPPLPEPEAETAAADAEGETELAAVDPGTASDAEADAPADADAVPASEGESFVRLVASSDPAAGERAGAVCKACHSFNEGGQNMVGPNLHGVVDGPIGAHDGYSYSSAMQNYGEEHEAWTVARLNTYLEAPMEVVPGTTMSYAGVKDREDRAAIIAWLRSVSPDASPLATGASVASADTASTADDEAASEDGAASQNEAAAPAEQAAGDAADPSEEPAADAAEDAATEADAQPEADVSGDQAAIETDAADDAAETASGDDSAASETDPDGSSDAGADAAAEGTDEAPDAVGDSASTEADAAGGDTADAADATAEPETSAASDAADASEGDSSAAEPAAAAAAETAVKADEVTQNANSAAASAAEANPGSETAATVSDGNSAETETDPALDPAELDEAEDASTEAMMERAGDDAAGETADGETDATAAGEAVGEATDATDAPVEQIVDADSEGDEMRATLDADDQELSDTAAPVQVGPGIAPVDSADAVGAAATTPVAEQAVPEAITDQRTDG